MLLEYLHLFDKVQAVTPAHREYLAGLKAAGILLASGPFDPRTGGALLLRVPDDDPQALDRIRDNDPFWQQGMANYELLPWAPGIGREGLEGL